MKIVLVHNTYQWPGGEDVIVIQERDLLRSAGHEVLEYRRSNVDVTDSTVIHRIALGQRAVWSQDVFREFQGLLAAGRTRRGTRSQHVRHDLALHLLGVR